MRFLLSATSLLFGVMSLHAAPPVASLSQDEVNAKLASIHIDIKQTPILHQAASYEVVDYDWLMRFLPRYRAELASKHITHYSPTFACTYYVMAFRVLAQEEYAAQVRGIPGDFPTALAIFSIDYYRDTDVRHAKSRGWSGNDDGPLEPTAHCIALVITNRGVVFFDPQSGVLDLSRAEEDSIYLVMA
jgi:hypothetical protein